MQIRQLCKKNKSLWHQEVFSTKIKNFKYVFGNFWDKYYEMSQIKCEHKRPVTDQVVPDLTKTMNVSSILRTMLSN